MAYKRKKGASRHSHRILPTSSPSIQTLLDTRRGAKASCASLCLWPVASRHVRMCRYLVRSHPGENGMTGLIKLLAAIAASRKEVY